MTLTETQATHCYFAMCALNDIGARVHIRIPEEGHYIHVSEYEAGDVQVFRGDAVGNAWEVETYQIQADFAAAYGLV